MDRIQCIGMIVGSFLVHFITVGMSLSFGILYSELHTEFDIVQSRAAWVASLFAGLIGVAGVPVSYFVTVFGERKVAIVGSLILTSGMLTSSFVGSFEWLYLTYGLLGGLGASACMLPATTIIIKSFHKNGRLMLAICASGSAVGSLALPPFLSYMISEYGWRGTYILLAGMALQTLPGSLMFVYEKSHKIDTSKAVEENMSSLEKGRTFKGKTLSIARNRTFMFFACSAVVAYFVILSPGAFLPDLMKEYMFTDQQIYIVLMTQGAGNLVGRSVLGIFDKMLNWDLLYLYIVILLYGTVTSFLYFVFNVFTVFIVLATSTGFVIGAFRFFHMSLVSYYLDADIVDVGFGWLCTLEGVAVIAGMPLAGLIIDTTQTQRSGFLFAAGVLFVSMVLAFVTKFSERRRLRAKATRF